MKITILQRYCNLIPRLGYKIVEKPEGEGLPLPTCLEEGDISIMLQLR